MSASIDYDELYRALVAEFIDSRAKATHHIRRLRKVADAVIVCCQQETFKAETFDVRSLLNELKTIERYIGKEAKRIAERDNVDRGKVYE